MKINRNLPILKHPKQQLSVFFNTETSLALRKKRITFRPGRLILLLIAALLVLILLINLLMIPSHRPRSIDMDFETGGNYTLIPFGNNILLYNKQYIKTVNTRGETLWSLNLPLSQPIVETAGDYVLAADLAGNSFAGLFHGGEKLQEFSLGNDIISAKLNKDGDCAFATAADGYKGKVTVFDKKGKEIFSWNSGEGYIMDIALSDNGKHLAVAQLISTTDTASSRIQFIDLSRKKVVGTADREGTVVTELRFSGSRLLAVSDLELCGFSGSGRFQYSVSFAGKQPGKYDISSDDLLAFLTSDNRGNAVLELYDTAGKLKGSYHADSGISNLAVCGSTVIVSRQRDIMYINSRGKLKKTVSSPCDIKSLGVFGDQKTVLAAGSTSAYIVRMR